MLIKFTNYKKVYILTGAFVVLIAGLYFYSESLSKKRINSDEIKVIESGIYKEGAGMPTGSQLSQEDINKTSELLAGKTNLLLTSISETKRTYESEAVFKNVDIGIIDKLKGSVILYDTPIKIEFTKAFVNPNGLSAAIYVSIVGNSGERSDTFEFIYTKYTQVDWRLYQLIIRDFGGRKLYSSK